MFAVFLLPYSVAEQCVITMDFHCDPARYPLLGSLKVNRLSNLVGTRTWYSTLRIAAGIPAFWVPWSNSNGSAVYVFPGILILSSVFCGKVRIDVLYTSCLLEESLR